MSDEDILALAEREAAFLSAGNDICAAAVMRALADRLRERRGPHIDANTRAINAAAGLGA